ncbi:MAG: UDP-3-O-(3-hydroxymyristoyl)glucosamine N-acyltransferase [Acidobacteriota bacterium]|nr:UDP-3-O-(3-hydroxymyristoyl)glucosamine N-acyltransferase [Blastocatellia bacterium]MDW8240401.1 UDP-3-O-(3-hydroxymyristoyl)glucosamine N-acyltransferase [Acidobacteriota bacterium]
MKLSEIAKKINATLIGEDIQITGVESLERAQPDHLTFLSNPIYKKFIKTTKAGAIITSPEITFSSFNGSVLHHPNPYLAFALCLELFHEQAPPPRFIHPTATIEPSATLGRNLSVGAHSYIGSNTKIGDNVVIFPNCTIYNNVTIGNDVVIHSNCVIREYSWLGNRVILQNGACIGSDGFGYAHLPDKSWYKIPQTGRVIIEDDVEIGANSTIDRPAVGETRIGVGVKIDNLVQIGHSCSIGSNSLLCAQVGLAGSTTLGRNVVLAGQVGVAGHLVIGDNVKATAQTGIPSSVPPDSVVSGYPAMNNYQWRKASRLFQHLPELVRKLTQLEKKLEKLHALHSK